MGLEHEWAHVGKYARKGVFVQSFSNTFLHGLAHEIKPNLVFLINETICLFQTILDYFKCFVKNSSLYGFKIITSEKYSYQL